jgi:hypothetical protein
MTEGWLPVVGFEGIYEVSDHGRVRCIPARGGRAAGYILKLSLNRPGGYLKTDMSGGGKRVTNVHVHKLVLTAFVGPCPAGMECRHLDSNPTNNHLSNLQWASHATNEADKVPRGTAPIGVKHGQAKLNDEKVREIRELCARGWSYQKIGCHVGVNKSTIHRVIVGKYWKHVI